MTKMLSFPHTVPRDMASRRPRSHGDRPEILGGQARPRPEQAKDSGFSARTLV
jgi:hypothetical protein